jgi:hypothetical protein
MNMFGTLVPKRQSRGHCACSHNWWRAWWNCNMEFRACWSKNKSRRHEKTQNKTKPDAGTGTQRLKTKLIWGFRFLQQSLWFWHRTAPGEKNITSIFRVHKDEAYTSLTLQYRYCSKLLILQFCLVLSMFRMFSLKVRNWMRWHNWYTWAHGGVILLQSSNRQETCDWLTRGPRLANSVSCVGTGLENRRRELWASYVIHACVLYCARGIGKWTTANGRQKGS